MQKMGIASNSISIENARREGLLLDDGFQGRTISYQASRTVLHSPLYKWEVIEFPSGQRNTTGKG